MEQFTFSGYRPILIYVYMQLYGVRACVFQDWHDWVFQSRTGLPYDMFEYETLYYRNPFLRTTRMFKVTPANDLALKSEQSN